MTRPVATTDRDAAWPRVWTIGHSTRPIEAFIELVAQQGVTMIADVRRYPGSRHQPQYGPDTLPATLAHAGIGYQWIAALGGRRHAVAGARPTAWKNAAFQGYAEYMQGAEFAAGVHELRLLAGSRHTAIMCAESLWWRCHRRIIADVLTVAGVPVWHIMDRSVDLHHLTPPARLVDGELSYQAEAPAA